MPTADEGSTEMSVTMESPAVAPVNGAVANVMRILRARGMSVPAAGEFEDRPDSTDEYQAQVNRTAWANSLALSSHDDYNRFCLERLAPEQEPERLRAFVDALVTVRRHNRAQLRVPAPDRALKTVARLNAVLSGNVGTGKTAAAIAAGSYAVDSGIMVRFLSHSRYLAWLRPNSAPAGMTTLRLKELHERCDLLIVDDLCNELDGYASTFVRTETADLLNARLHSGRATIFTTNLNSAQVGEVLGERFASRIGSQAAHFKMVGGDRRRPLKW